MTKTSIEKFKESTTIPVIMAPMFLINDPNMVLRACEAGIIGTFPALNARTNEILEGWFEQITTEWDRIKTANPDKKIAPWGINFISHRSNKRFTEDLQLIKKYQPPLIITSLGDPSPVVEIAHQYGGVVFSDVINVKFAKKAIEKGVDGLVLVCSGAGGHGGTYSPFAFIHEVKTFWDGPVVLAGAMSKGEDILAAEILGADFAYLGSRFIPAKESLASEAYKKMVIESRVEDIIYTDAFSGVNANYLIPSIKQVGLDPEKLQRKEKIDFSELGNPNIRAWKDVWSAGQGVGAITQVQSLAEIVAELKQQYEAAKEKIVKRSVTF
ncbi:MULTISPECIES: NAD(P)H-dependent flavin oxidoreductase [Bacillaceae]|uniref:NAD(P)H-dependent flavin oxidoreductase n=1 Tax=Bacillaceae TaxID=186817 RepID=UPI0005A49A41|nr:MULTISPECIES: nitronate monooxygenase [Bacillaceae]MCB5934544.1 nitronate monooxygenase [Bacillus sp. DFI.2.34]NWN98183.1 nitronate monooxygenase [Bacillus sp. (in: firmicutes)]KIO69610.1 2-nitropropane dioxygenase [Caldibacillus thermoamylovorans]MCB7077721.1 nitronate monooxygenase [Caldibacillus thermoamylovorans]MCM3800236.1 nitronate monooxygenase [Caldibacillus thermoamylovorans]